MFRITLPDGSVREVAPGTTPADIAAAIGPGWFGLGGFSRAL
ncbi:TGS domain-containing protein, partial [Actinomadura sp. DSM 109109]|nr:TGS domain-containing protein [Actinomadura lepetitiana]